MNGMLARTAHAAGLLDLVNASIIVLDLDGRVLKWYGASQRLYGWNRQQATGAAIDQLFGESNTPFYPQLQQLGLWDGELSRRAACGKRVHVHVRRVLRYDVAGIPKDVVETAMDVSELRDANARLDLMQYRCNSMFQAISMSLLELDFTGSRDFLSHLLSAGVADLGTWLGEHPEAVREMMRRTRVVDVNPQAHALFGRADRGELLHGIDLFWPASSHGDYVQSVLAALDGADHFTCETRLCNLDGKELDVFFSVSYLPEMLASGKVIVTIMDISKKKAELAVLKNNDALYHKMFHVPGVSTWLLDNTGANKAYEALRHQGVTDLLAYSEAHTEFIQELLENITVIDVNHTTLTMFNIPAREQVIGGSIAAYWPERSRTFIEAVAAMYKTELNYGNETPMRTLDGREIWAWFNVTASLDLQAAGRTLVTLVDITARVHAQNALLGFQATYAHGARISSLGELAASIAHEVNQPLSAIIARSEAALSQLADTAPELGKVRQITSDIIVDARRAADIIRRIRSMAAPHADLRRRLSLNNLTEECLLFIRHDARRRGIAHTLLLASDMPDICGDAVQLQQVVVNLALNAFHAMEHTAHPHLTVRTCWEAPARVRLEIEDNGPGIPVERFGSLFDRFFTTKNEGMGMGLAICRSIIEAHDGSIEADNMLSGGARFTLRLPLAA